MMAYPNFKNGPKKGPGPLGIKTLNLISNHKRKNQVLSIPRALKDPFWYWGKGGGGGKTIRALKFL
jgi:hypothetical protein